MKKAFRWCKQCHQFDECYDEFGGPYLLTLNCYSYRQRKTEIPITSLHTGGTEQQTQAVIDALQAQGWNVVWGMGPMRFCSEDERMAFEEDFRQTVPLFVPQAEQARMEGI